jgi:hypothetical protein
MWVVWLHETRRQVEAAAAEEGQAGQASEAALCSLLSACACPGLVYAAQLDGGAVGGAGSAQAKLVSWCGQRLKAVAVAADRRVGWRHSDRLAGLLAAACLAGMGAGDKEARAATLRKLLATHLPALLSGLHASCCGSEGESEERSHGLSPAALCLALLLLQSPLLPRCPFTPPATLSSHVCGGFCSFKSF